MIRLITSILTCALAGPVAASPLVVTDIAPVHSLVTQVMDGVAPPDVLLPPHVDLHHYSMSVRDAAKLDQAEIMIWVGPALTPWLAAPLATLADDAETLVLSETKGWDALRSREDRQTFRLGHTAHSKDPTQNEAQDHEDDGHRGTHADEDGNADGHTTDTATHDTDHDASHDAGHDTGHDTGHDADLTGLARDPHAWLDPTIAASWAITIAEHLAQADPQHAAVYLANATRVSERLTALADHISTRLGAQPTKGYILSHDGYQYFEHRFGIAAHGHITNSHGAEPGPAHIQTLRDMVLRKEVSCVFTDQESDPAWADLLVEGTDARVIALQSVLPADTSPSDLYVTQIKAYADAFLDCFAPAG